MRISKWIIEGLENNHYNVENVAIGEQLVITMIDDAGVSKFNIIFNHFYSFDIADESYRLKFLYKTRDSRKGNGVFWIFEESPQLKNFHEQGLGFYESLVILHYAIYTENDCIDILTTELPQMQLL